MAATARTATLRAPRTSGLSIWWAAARTGTTAALAGAAGAVVIVVIWWLPDAGVSGHPMSAIRAGLLSFLASQGGGVRVDGVATAFVPLGMTVATAVIAWRAGRRLAAEAEDTVGAADSARTAESGTAESGTVASGAVASGRLLGGALAVQACCYTAVCAVLVPLAALGTSSAPLRPVVVAAFLLFSTTSGLAVVQGTDLCELALDRVPAVVRGGARAAAAAVVVYLACGALLALGSVLLHAGRVMDLSRQVGGGLSGFPIAVLGALCAPNAVVAGAAYLAGPGFAVGAGTSVNAFSTSHGVLPAFPLLGAVPDGHGAAPVVLALMVLCPLAAGLGAAVLVRRRGLVDLLEGCLAMGVAAALAGCAMALLAWLGGGSVGPGRLRVIGASPWQVAVAVALAVGLVGLVTLLGHWMGQRVTRGRRGRALGEAVGEPADEELMTAGS
jgi:Family of unknown function (DUF6350)